MEEEKILHFGDEIQVSDLERVILKEQAERIHSMESGMLFLARQRDQAVTQWKMIHDEHPELEDYEAELDTKNKEHFVVRIQRHIRKDD